ncbi:MAG TPA: hypothetical protein VFE59_09220 [Trebonia sp.]|jgi:hypothetical protein|nr:hypothetical protein [Trebonia sp.]
MDWEQDMTARWVRILSRLQRNAVTPAEARAVTVLSRQLIAGVLFGDLMADRLCALTGQSRDQLLDQLSGSMPGELPDHQLRALQAALSSSGAPSRGPERATYAGLGDRIEQLLRLAEEQIDHELANGPAQRAC